MYREAGPPINDGERMVLQLLRDELGDDWYVLGNFEFPSGARWYECDALAINPEGWAYLVETKHWVGRIHGNDHEWLRPSLVGGGKPNAVQSPVHITGTKAKKLATYLKGKVPGWQQIVIQPIVVLVTDVEPELTGKSAAQTVTIANLIDRLRTDPRPDQARRPPEGDVAWAGFDTLTRNSRPLRGPEELGPYRLLELLEASDSSELWEAALSPDSGIRYRLKRHFIDPLLTGTAAEQQRAAVRRDLDALTLLQAHDGVVPFVGNYLEVDNSFVVATTTPPGRVLASVLAEGEVEEDEVEPLVEQLLRSLAAIHERDVIHRNLRPSSLYVSAGRVFVTNFDFARITGQPGVTATFEPLHLDPAFTAPEVLRDLSEASPRSDLYSAAAIARAIVHSVPGGVTVSPALDRVIQQCLALNAQDRPVSAREALAALVDVPVERISVERLRVNDVIDQRFVVRARANTTGGTAVVYRVFDQDSQAEYAAKFVRPELTGQVDVADEFRRLRRVPEHPAIVRPAFPMRSHSVRRAGSDHRFDSAFLLTDWVQGSSLAELLSTGLPVARVMQIGRVIADALAVVDREGVVHRDVKPENIILREAGAPVLIDFNISASAEDSLTTRVGTLPYMPPELGVAGGRWTAAADIYALGICLAELVARSRLGARALAWVQAWDGGAEVEGLREALAAMLAEDPLVRPNGAAVDAMLAQAITQFRNARAVPSIGDPPAYEKRHPNHNPYVDQLIGLFSQSSRSNAGTRGLDDFRRWLYVDTRIDRELRPAVLGGDLRLLVISGNAGDGKTAFIRMIEDELLARGARVDSRADGNGTVLSYEGLQFVTNWDGSQDEGDTSNDEVLRRFFDPFAGDDPAPADKLVAVIAINEGRLLDFLASNRTDFGWLERELLDVLGGMEGTAPWLSVVNLNARALTAAGQGEDPSIVHQLLTRMADERLWQACGSCAIQKACYANANAEALRDPVVGPRRAERVRQALDLVRLRRRLHITMRDLMSALSFVVAGNRQCADIVALYESANLSDIIGGFTYNALFAAGDAGLRDTQSAERDRLLAELSPLDVAARPLPEDDARLWHRGSEAIPRVEQLSREPDRQLLDELWTTARESGRESGDWVGLRIAHTSLRRKYYLEREDTAYLDMFPYEHLRSFVTSLERPPSEAVQQIAEAISHSEGLRASEGTGLLAVRVVQQLGAQDRSFVTHDATLFDLQVVDRGAASRFVESLPDLLRFGHGTTSTLTLDIDVDLWEALMRMRSGFIPSREDLRGSWLSLQTFKEQVASMPSRQLLIQPRSGDMTRLHVDDAGRIVAGAVR